MKSTGLKEFNQILSALEQIPGTLAMLDPELHKHVPSIETVTREFSEFKSQGPGPETPGTERKGAAPGQGTP